MHASAHPTERGDMLIYSGTLLHAAEARTRMLDGITTVPVICLDLELDTPWHNHMHVEQPFPAHHHAQAHAAAHRLKKGMRVTVQVPLIDTRLVAPNAAHIHVINLPEEASTEAPAS